MGIGRFVYTPILPFMMEGIGLTKPEAGLLASSNFLGYLLGALAAASPVFAGSRRAWFGAGLLVSALSTGAMGEASTMPTFLMLRFLGGVASAFVLVFASALVLDRLAALGRSRLAALHFAGVGCGIAFSALLIAALASAGLGWRVQWLASGGASLLALAACWRFVPPEANGARAPSPARRGEVRNGRLLRLAIAYGLFGFGYVITATFISTIARSSPALQAAEPVVWLAVGVAAAPSVAFWTAVASRCGNEGGYALACLTQAVGVALSVLAPSLLGLMAAAVLLGGTIMGLTALGLIEARLLASTDPRRSLALMTAAFGLGQMVGPSFAGFAYGLAGSFLLPSLAAVAALLVAAGLVGLPALRRAAAS